MTTILKGYYLKVTLENRLVKHNGRKVYLSIVEHGNGIPDHALILKTSAKCLKFSVCLSIRSQCGWKELDQNDSGELTFDLKVEVNGKSQRAPLFPLIFQLCEKHYDQVVIISKSVIPVKAITKIPKKSLRAELVPLGEAEINPPSCYLASPGDSLEEDVMEEDKDESTNNNTVNDEDEGDEILDSTTGLRVSSSSVAHKKSKISKDDESTELNINNHVIINNNSLNNSLNIVSNISQNNEMPNLLPNIRNSTSGIGSSLSLSTLVNKDSKSPSLENLLNSSNNKNVLLNSSSNATNTSMSTTAAATSTTSKNSTGTKKRRSMLSSSAPNVPQQSLNYNISSLANNINNGFNNFKVSLQQQQQQQQQQPTSYKTNSSLNNNDLLDPLNYLSHLALQATSNNSTVNNNNVNNNVNNNHNSNVNNTLAVNTPPESNECNSASTTTTNSPTLYQTCLNMSSSSQTSISQGSLGVNQPFPSSNPSSPTLMNTRYEFSSPDTEKSPNMNGKNNSNPLPKLNSSSSNISAVSSISSSINNHFNNHKFLMNSINNLLIPGVHSNNSSNGINNPTTNSS